MLKGKQLFTDILQNSYHEKFGNISEGKIVWWSSILVQLQSSHQQISLIKGLFHECYFKDIEYYIATTIYNTVGLVENDEWSTAIQVKNFLQNLLDRDAPENSYSKNHRKMKGALLQRGIFLQVPLLLF